MSLRKGKLATLFYGIWPVAVHPQGVSAALAAGGGYPTS
jgi:hypothetical protein